MSKVTPICHGTFTLNRSWAAPPCRVFSAWSDPHLKQQWFGPPPGEWTALRRTVDFRPGGIEIHEGKFSSGMTTRYEGRFHLIEENQRLIFAYDLHHADRFHSVTLATLVLQANGARTEVSYTEQIAYLDGTDGTAQRQHGTEYLFRGIEKLVEEGAR